MKTFLFFILLLFLVVAFSCNEERNPVQTEHESEIILKRGAVDYLNAVNRPSSQVSDPFELGEMVIDGNKLNIAVSYSGGCKKHTFEVIWDEAFSNTNPPAVNIVVLHDAHGDACEAYVHEVISFRLDSLLDSSNFGEVRVNACSGWDNQDTAVYEGNQYAFNFEESDACNLTVTARAAICGWGLYGNVWFALDDKISAGTGGYYFHKYLQPVSIDKSLEGFTPEEGQKYRIGARIDKNNTNFSDVITCLAYPGPSVPVKIMCIKKLE